MSLGPLRLAAEHIAQRAPAAARAVAAPSPCNAVCRMDEASGLCSGCLRTIDEIIEWGRASDARRREVWASLAQRSARLLATPPSPPAVPASHTPPAA